MIGLGSHSQDLPVLGTATGVLAVAGEVCVVVRRTSTVTVCVFALGVEEIVSTTADGVAVTVCVTAIGVAVTVFVIASGVAVTV